MDEVDFEERLLAAVPGLRARLKIGQRFQSLIHADDVIQVTFMEAFAKRASFHGETEAAFRAWVGRIADNNLRDAIKELSRDKRPDAHVRAVSDEESASRFLEALVPTSHTPSRSAAGREARDILLAAVARLPLSYRTVVEAVDLGGASISELAERLGKTPGAVHMLRARAHDRMRELLGSGSRFFSKGP